jgi:hypothetical protein
MEYLDYVLAAIKVTLRDEILDRIDEICPARHRRRHTLDQAYLPPPSSDRSLPLLSK